MDTLFRRTTYAVAFAVSFGLAPANLCLAASASSHASATVMPMAVAVSDIPVFVEVARASAASNTVVVSVVTAAVRADGASLSAALVSNDAAPTAALQATQVAPAKSDVIATVRASDNVAVTPSGMLANGQRLSATVSQSELGAQGQVALTLNYN